MRAKVINMARLEVALGFGCYILLVEQCLCGFSN